MSSIETRKSIAIASVACLCLVVLATGCNDAPIADESEELVEHYYTEDGESEGTDDGRCEPRTRAGDVVLETAADLEALRGVTVITDRLTVRGTDLKELGGLECLERVGALYIERNSSLVNINGFSGLTSVFGELSIVDNPDLTNIDGLGSLEDVAGSVRLERNRRLEDVDGFASLWSIGADLQVEQNRSLNNLEGLSELESVANMVFVTDNESLVTLGFDALIEVGIALHITGNGSLPSCEAEALGAQVENGTSIDEDIDLHISNNDDEATCE